MSPGQDHDPASPTEEFFRDLAARGRDPLVKGASGTVRFDIVDGDHEQHWCVAMRQGEVAVSRGRSKADAVVRLDRALFEGLLDGSVNAMAATLRGELVADGDLGLVMHFGRLFRPAEVPRR